MAQPALVHVSKTLAAGRNRFNHFDLKPRRITGNTSNVTHRGIAEIIIRTESAFFPQLDKLHIRNLLATTSRTSSLLIVPYLSN